MLSVFLVGLRSQASEVPRLEPSTCRPRGFDDEAEVLESYFLEGLRERALGTAQQRERTADFFSFVLTVSDVEFLIGIGDVKGRRFSLRARRVPFFHAPSPHA